MVDQIALLNANVSVLVAAVANLTTVVKEHIHVCECGRTAPPAPDSPDSGVADSSATLMIDPVLLEEDAVGLQNLTLNTSTGNSPGVIRDHLSEFTGPSQTGPWYTVTVGFEPGVYQHIDEVAHNTNGVSGNSQKKYSSKAAALEAYERAWNLGAVRRVR